MEKDDKGPVQLMEQETNHGTTMDFIKGMAINSIISFCGLFLEVVSGVLTYRYLYLPPVLGWIIFGLVFVVLEALVIRYGLKKNKRYAAGIFTGLIFGVLAVSTYVTVTLLGRI